MGTYPKDIIVAVFEDLDSDHSDKVSVAKFMKMVAEAGSSAASVVKSSVFISEGAEEYVEPKKIKVARIQALPSKLHRPMNQTLAHVINANEHIVSLPKPHLR